MFHLIEQFNYHAYNDDKKKAYPFYYALYLYPLWISFYRFKFKSTITL